MSKIFCISDTWFNIPNGKYFGENHINYNKSIINSWIKTVDDGDTVYVLGGFGIGDLYDIVFSLSGNIVFLNNFFSKDEIDSLEDLKYRIENSINKDLKNRVIFLDSNIEILQENDIILSYFPLADWTGKNTGTMCFHGMRTKTDMNNLNVCCNVEYWSDKVPVDIEHVISNMKKFKTIV